MKKSHKTLCGLVLAAGALALTGCEATNYKEGIVIEEYGNIHQIMESGIPLKGDDNLKVLVYGIKVKTIDGVYNIEVDVNDNESLGYEGGHTAFNLAMDIERGSKIKFATKFGEAPLFKEDKIGKLDPDHIIIIQKNPDRPY